ncbi:MAG: thiosulfate oxidation carrier protein SoxY [Rhodospirillales bacterium]|nr:MAG: thiosulfate oxidation carrier protein SoxY [Rhodospirillales bacterium]
MDSSPHVTRRHVLVLTGAAAVAAGTGLLPSIAAADKAAVEAAIKKAVGDASTMSGRITLDLPQIAENGNTVPIGIEVDSPMTESDYVKSVHIFAEGNPNPEVASLHFTPANGVAKASTRMRLLRTQNVVAVAKMSDGSVYRETVEVKVTIGGCGG